MSIVDKIIPKDLYKKILNLEVNSERNLVLNLEWYELSKYLHNPNLDFSPVVSRFEWEKFWKFHKVYKPVRESVIVAPNEFYNYAHNASEILSSLNIEIWGDCNGNENENNR